MIHISHLIRSGDNSGQNCHQTVTESWWQNGRWVWWSTVLALHSRSGYNPCMTDRLMSIGNTRTSAFCLRVVKAAKGIDTCWLYLWCVCVRVHAYTYLVLCRVLSSLLWLWLPSLPCRGCSLPSLLFSTGVTEEAVRLDQLCVYVCLCLPVGLGSACASHYTKSHFSKQYGSK